MEIKIYPEVQNDQSGKGKIVNWQDLMSEEDFRIGKYYNNLYLTRQAEIMENKEYWDELNDLYACYREAFSDDDDYPNNFFPIITPCVEGQVASIIEGGIEFSHATSNPAHTQYMVQYDAASEFARRQNRYMDHFKDFTRKYDLYGTACITPSWEKRFAVVKGKPVGFPRLMVCPLLSVIVDGRIKDVKDVQYAEYIIHEIGFQTLQWAREEYKNEPNGDELVNNLTLGYNRYEGKNPDQSVDDSYSFTLLHVWTRSNEQHNLQLIEMDSNGFVLRKSDPSEPYYKYTENEYPFYFSRMMPVDGEFYGHGDGTLLKKLQEGLNNLVDEMELACRFSAQPKIIVDPKAKMALDQLTSNPADIAIATNPRENIMILQAAGINPVVIQMIQLIRSFAPEATRFAQIMTGNQQGVSATATQINSQMMQGQVGINDKKSDIARAMEWTDRYCLKLCMQYWTKPFWSTLGHDFASNNTYVDPKGMLKAPSAIPVTAGVLEKTNRKFGFLGGLFGRGKVKEDLARGEDNELIYTDIDFDTNVYIGRGISKDKTSMHNILMSLAGVLLRNAQGQPVGVISPKRWIELEEQALGMKLTSEEDDQPELENTTFDQAALTGMNPISGNGTLQRPQYTPPENLQSTVPTVAGGDNRKLSM